MKLDQCPKEFASKTKREASWWIRAAWTVPFACLAGFFFLHFIGWNSFYNQILIISATAFFSVSVYWWWWAIYKIVNIADILERTVENFEKVKDELKKFKTDLKN
jgi:biotin transporter BioY